MPLLLFLVLLAWPLASQTSGSLYIASTVAGIDAVRDGGPATDAILVSVSDIKVDAGCNLYIADFSGNRVRRVSSDGVIRTVAGRGFFGASGDGGPAQSADLSNPGALALDKDGNLYIAETNGNRVRFVSADGAVTRTVAGMIGRQGGAGDGGPATRAELFLPFGLALDKDGSLYIAEGPANRGRIRKVTPDGIIRTIAGNGQNQDDGVPALEADLGRLRHIAMDEAGSLYFVENNRHRIRKISPEGIVTTVAGTGAAGFSGDGGPAREAELSNPAGLALDRGNTLYIADAGNGRVRSVDADGTISTVVQFETPAAGVPGSMGAIQAVTLDETGVLYVAFQKQVHRMPAADPVVDSPFAGGNTTRGQDDVPATESVVWAPAAAIADPRGNLYILEPENYRVRIVTPEGTIRTLAGGTPGFSGDGGPAAEARFTAPRSLAVDKDGNLYVADLSTARVRMVSAASGLISTVAGDGRRVSDGDGGPAQQAGLLYPQSIAVDGRGNLYIADSQAHRVRKVTPEGMITTFAGTGRPGSGGDGGPAADATLNWPTSVTTDAAGNVYFLDNFAARLRRVSRDGIISGTSVPFFVNSANVATRAVAIAIDPTGRPILAYPAEVLRAQTDTEFTRIAGDGVFGWSGDEGPATQARFANLSGLWVDPSGAILLADTANHRIRKLTPAGQP